MDEGFFGYQLPKWLESIPGIGGTFVKGAAKISGVQKNLDAVDEYKQLTALQQMNPDFKAVKHLITPTKKKATKKKKAKKATKKKRR